MECYTQAAGFLNTRLHDSSLASINSTPRAESVVGTIILSRPNLVPTNHFVLLSNLCIQIRVSCRSIQAYSDPKFFI